jgi:hypothetical protein
VWPCLLPKSSVGSSANVLTLLLASLRSARTLTGTRWQRIRAYTTRHNLPQSRQLSLRARANRTVPGGASAEPRTGLITHWTDSRRSAAARPSAADGHIYILPFDNGIPSSFTIKRLRFELDWQTSCHEESQSNGRRKSFRFRVNPLTVPPLCWQEDDLR